MAFGNTLILGDSYSTFKGYIPEGYDVWYSEEGREETDVCLVEQTWWYGLFKQKENTLLRNDSYSGATICNSVRECHTIDASFVSRFDRLIKDGFFEKHEVETIIVLGGTNDSWTDAPIGQIPKGDITKEDLLEFIPACCYLASRIHTAAPKARVLWIINDGLKPEITEGIKYAAGLYGQEYFELEGISKKAGHPDIAGMKQIAEMIGKICDKQ